MSLTGRNPTIRLSIIRSQIDRQQQVIALLENRLQEAILGGTDVGNVFRDQHLDGLLGEVAAIYGDQPVIDSLFGFDSAGNPLPGPNGEAAVTLPTYTGLSGAMHKGSIDFQQFDSNGDPLPLEQDALRQLLYQARALMGELRVEEQHWNGEVNEEKARRKELGDLSKA